MPGLLVALLFALVAVTGCEATMPPPPANIPIPPPSGKAQLDASDIEHAMEPLLEAIADCAQKYRDMSEEIAHLVVEPDGTVSAVKVTGGINISQRACIKRDLRQARLPAFTGPPMTIDYVVMRASKRRYPQSPAHRPR